MRKILLPFFLAAALLLLPSCRSSSTDSETANDTGTVEVAKTAEKATEKAADTKKAKKNEKCGDDAYWTLADGVLTVTGTGDMYDFTVDYDAANDGWIGSAPWFEERTAITEAVISEGITNLGDETFRGCLSLTKVSMPETLLRIGENAFKGCLALGEVIIPDSVKVLGNDIFGTSTITSLVMGAGIEECGERICKECKYLTQVTFKEGMKAIGENAFESCYGLTEIILPDSLTSLGEGAFSSCTHVTRLVIGRGLTEIPRCAFMQCSVSDVLTIPEGVETIHGAAFYGNEMTTLELPSTLKAVEKNAFYSCGEITDIYYNGTKNAYWKITRESGNDILQKAHLHYADAE